MSTLLTKRNADSRKKSEIEIKKKSRKVEYNESDISSNESSGEENKNSDDDNNIEEDAVDLSSMQELPALEDGQGKTGTFLMCGNTNWDTAGGRAAPKNTNSIGKSLWTPHTFENLKGSRVRLVVSGPSASHNVIVTEDNRCLVFGRNDKGQLGLGDTTRRDIPTDVEALKNHRIIAAACGHSHTLFLTSHGLVYAAGDNKAGQCGVGSSTKIIIPIATKLKYSGAPIIKVGCGVDFSMIVDIEGNVYSFGSPEHGQLGHNTDGQYFITPSKLAFQYVTVPKKIVTYIQKTKDGQLIPINNIKIKEISCGNNHTVAIDSEGRAFSWGFGGFGRLGHSGQTDELVPRLINAFAPADRRAKLAYCGNFYSIVINTSGQPMLLGLLKKGGEANMYPKAIFDLIGWDIRCVGCSQATAVIAANESVIAWGSGPTYGELGLGDKRKSSSVPLEVEALKGLYITSITCGSSHTLFICDDETKEDKDKINKLPKYSVET